MNTRWKPNVTVATVVERVREGKNGSEPEYLLVYEKPDQELVYNQPAGHLDEGEGLQSAAIRETLEETGWDVELTGLIGIYRFIAPNGITYLRHAFSARPLQHHPDQALDDGIVAAQWLTYDNIVQKKDAMRSQMVIETLDDYRKKGTYPLEILQETS